VGTARLALITNSFFTSSRIATVTNSESTGSTPAFSSAGNTNVIDVPLRQIWGNVATLQDHFDRHGHDFAARDAEDYAQQAWRFLERARLEGLPAKRDRYGVLRVYDPQTRAFAACGRDGKIKTYFKPQRPDYFDTQPGEKVDLRRE